MNRRVSSPISTGAAGSIFEQHVDAYWLALLLVRGIPPILRDCTVSEVHLQTEHLGWSTDDCLIVGVDGSGRSRKLACQVKLAFTLSSKDGECRNALRDFWKDFRNHELFGADRDRMALVTLRGTNTLLDFAGVLDCARSSQSELDFEHRLGVPGFINANSRRYCEVLRTIIGEIEGRDVSSGEIWPFLKVLHVLSLDLNSSTGQTEGAIKSLLANLTKAPDAVGVAETTWESLLHLAGQAMPQARSFTRDDLPEKLRLLHACLPESGHRALFALMNHSSLIVDSIRSTIGQRLHLERSLPVQQILRNLESSQVVIVSGPAGSGKSGMAKEAYNQLVRDYFAFCFRAEELAHPHLDAALQNSQIPTSAAELGAVLAGQPKKVLLVESIERLLESSSRDAFADLLTLLRNDPSWLLLMTCRDYSVDAVRSSFLQSAGLRHAIVTAPPLSDADLEQVEKAYPALGVPLRQPALRILMRYPYVLDKALQIDWSEDHPLPRSEREFRFRFWKEVVRAEGHPVRGLPRRRETAFGEVALRRARSLVPYAPCGDLDEEAVAGLKLDSLIASSPEHDALMAPAHDVLEDWAILQWIEEQFATHGESVGSFAAALGTSPAIRRTCRKWMGELLESGPGSAEALVRNVLEDSDLDSCFRDDMLVSLLRSSGSVGFLESHVAELFADGKKHLRRMIHLLRVACVTTPPWFDAVVPVASLFNMPDSPAWACVMRLVQQRLDSFEERDHPLLLGLIEDWSNGVHWWKAHHYPAGYEASAAIGHWLLPKFEDHDSTDLRKRTMRVIAKIPNGDPERFAALLQGKTGDRGDGMAFEEFREIVLCGLEGGPAARDLPQTVISAAKGYLLCSDADLRNMRRRYGTDLEIEPLFGIRQDRHHDFFPSCAYRGPFLPLLRWHPQQAIPFLISILNKSAERYSNHMEQSRHVEPPFGMTLELPDGSSRKQWCNERLWCLHRGSSVGPHVLQTLLMALERWLLEFAEHKPGELDGTLLDILARGDSAALTAVVASVATAFPHASGETMLVLTRSRICLQLDRVRLAKESQSASRIRSAMPFLNTWHQAYEDERKESDGLPHRCQDLQSTALLLQFGPYESRIQEIIDRHLREVSPVEIQDENDRIWRFALHHMDRRKQLLTPIENGSLAGEKNANPDGGERLMLRIEPVEPEKDLAEMRDKSAERLVAVNASLDLMMWGINAFKRELPPGADLSQWRSRLSDALAALAAPDFDPDGFGGGGPGYVAAVCIRDHWEESSDEDKSHCVDICCGEVERHSDSWNQHYRPHKYEMSADRPSAWVMALLPEKTLSEERKSRVQRAFAAALTHAVDEVRGYAALGIGSNLWTTNRNLAIRSVNAIALEAGEVGKASDAERSRLRQVNDAQKYSSDDWLDPIEARTAASIRQRFFESGGIPVDALDRYDPGFGFGHEASVRILVILGQAPLEPISIAQYKRLAGNMVGWWKSAHAHNQEKRGGNYETVAMLEQLLENFLMRTSPEAARSVLEPILAVVGSRPEEVQNLLRGLISVEDRSPNTPQFWLLWNLLCEKVRKARWLDGLDDRHSSGRGLVAALFLGAYWKEEVRHWRSLEGYADNVHSLFEELPACSAVLENYLAFLYRVGSQSLPDAFVRISMRLRHGDHRQMLKSGNTVFLLEALLQRFVYSKPLELKSRSSLREAVLNLLDTLVDHGSSSAFRMRDDFVTPLNP